MEREKTNQDVPDRGRKINEGFEEAMEKRENVM